MSTPHISTQVKGAHAAAKANVTAPFEQNIIATIDVSDRSTIDTALATAHQCYSNKDSWLSKTQRIAILQRTAEIMQTEFDSLALEAAREGGKPLMDSKVEVARAIDGVHNCIDCIKNDGGSAIPMGINPASEHRLAVTQSEPIGVVVAVSAFNHPLNLIIHQVGPAIASGCPVIVKPSKDTPLSCFRFVNILREAGLPEEWCQAVYCDSSSTSEALVCDPRVSFFSFIGSAKIGWMLRSKLAPGARCALEHGGVAPVIIDSSADLNDALPLIAKGGFYHAGQVCVSVQRVYVHSSIKEHVIAELQKHAEKLIVGDPTQEATEVGPIIRPSELERIHNWVSEAVEEGAELITGGHILENNCYQPTILVNPNEKSKVSQKEVFGPVICLYEYDDINQAIHAANALEVSFQAAIFSQNIDTAMKAYKGLNASAVMVNDHTAFRVDWMPFAGLKHSGLGVGGIPHTFHDMQIEKMLMIRSTEL